jgi:hypothetical protein
MTWTKTVCCAALAAGLLCSGLVVGTQAASEADKACADDIQKFCKNVEGGPAAILGCLEQHEAELSEACRVYEAKVEGRRSEGLERAKVLMRFRRDCGPDIVKFCNDVNPEQQGLLKCVKEHEDGLSPACSTWLKAEKAEEPRAK